MAEPGDSALLDTARDERRIWRESDPDWTTGVPVRAETIPVTREDRVIAVIERNTNLNSARTPSRLELTYLQGADDLARMVAEGTFPFGGEEATLARSPRVGDGLLRLGRAGRVTYASPNALSAFRRLGLATDLVGAELGPLVAKLCAACAAPLDESLMLVAYGRVPRDAEIEGNGSIVQLRSIPLIVGGSRTGALILVRDVTELRRRERELMTKDATIREIHHRVKNNLQTVAALLRLQARRLHGPEARAALEDAVRRVGSIAIVHETLSHAPDEIVAFDEVADRVVMMASEVAGTEIQVTPKLTGTFGPLPAYVAMPLALVLTELLQNALQHGFAYPAGQRRDQTVHRQRRGERGARAGPADGRGHRRRRGAAGRFRPRVLQLPRAADRADPGRRRAGREAGDHAPAGRRDAGPRRSPRAGRRAAQGPGGLAARTDPQRLDRQAPEPEARGGWRQGPET